MKPRKTARSSPQYPAWVCKPCGLKYGKRHMPENHVATWHIGACDVCATDGVPVTEPRDFGHLENYPTKESEK